MAGFPLDFEAINVPPRSARIVMPTIKSATRSSYAGVEQQQIWNDGPLSLQMTFPPMLREQAERLVTFKTSLDLGQGGNRFIAGVATQKTPMGLITGSPLVAVAALAQSNDLILKNVTPTSTTAVIKAGDWVQFGTGENTRIYKVQYDANSDPTGVVEITVRPGLRLAVAADDPVFIAPARGLWELVESEVAWDIDVLGHQRMTLEAIEAMG